MGSFLRAGLCGIAISLGCPSFAQNASAVPASSSAVAAVAVVNEVQGVVAAPDDLPVPLVRGINFLLTSSSQHDSPTGWSNVLEPDLSYRFNDHFAVDVSVPYYTRVNAFIPTTVGHTTTYPVKTDYGLLGDTVIGGQFDWGFNWLSYSAWVSLGLPTGDSQFGLSADQPTYNFSNHFEHSIGIFTPNVELGIGDSSSLANDEVRKTYTAVGNLGFFQAGSMIDLPKGMIFDAEAFEALPIGDQRVYGTITRKKKTVQVLEGTGVAEDNGFNVSVLIPAGRHLGVLGYYTRSLRQHSDSVGFSFTYFMRVPPKKHE
jgi:hypothetical protein